VARRQRWFATVAFVAAPLAVADSTEPVAEEVIVVTAARTVSPLEVVTDPKAPRQPVPAHDGADYLKTIPGFSVIRKGGTDGDPLFRGMAGSRVNIVADDANLLGGCGMRMDPPTAYVFPQSYDLIRVLKGPQSVLWGAGGSAATVLFERDRYDHATDGNHVDASVLEGSFGRRDLFAEGLVGNERGYLRANGSHATADDYDDGKGNAVHGEYTRWHGNAAIGFTPDDATTIELSASLSDGEAAYADRAMDGTMFERESYALELERTGISETVRRVSGQVAWSYVDHVMDNYTLRPFVPSMMMPNPAASNPDRETVSARLATELALGDTLGLEVGADAQRNEHSVRSTMNQTTMRYQTLPRRDDATFAQLGLFGEATWRPLAGHTWVAGLRLDRSEVDDERETVRQGMMVVPNDTAGAQDDDLLTSGFLRYEHALARPSASDDAADTVLFAGLGYAERGADYWERFGNDKQSVDTNSAFFTDPERTTQLDVGVVRTGADRRLAASVFANAIDDYVLIDTRVPGKQMNTVVTRNVDARSYGAELEVSQTFAARWRLDGTLAWTRGENRTDDRPLAQMPPLEARLGFGYVADGWTVGGLLRWVDAQDRVDVGRGNIVGQDIGETDAFTVFSLNGSYQAGVVRLSAGVDNLFDAMYSEHLSRAGAMVAGYVQTERVAEPGQLWWLKADLAL
jgi:iron complex outermembrane receptor protein